MAFEKFINEVRYKNWKEHYSEIPSIYKTLDQIQIIYKFPNGYGASVIHGLASHDLELAVLYEGDLCYSTPITDNVVGYIESQEELENLLGQIYELK